MFQCKDYPNINKNEKHTQFQMHWISKLTKTLSWNVVRPMSCSFVIAQAYTFKSSKSNCYKTRSFWGGYRVSWYWLEICADAMCLQNPDCDVVHFLHKRVLEFPGWIDVWVSERVITSRILCVFARLWGSLRINKSPLLPVEFPWHTVCTGVPQVRVHQICPRCVCRHTQWVDGGFSTESELPVPLCGACGYGKGRRGRATHWMHSEDFIL